MPNLLLKHRQRALTIVELLIALAIGSLIILVVTQVYLSSFLTNRLSNEMTLLNNKSLFAFEIMERNLREAGFSSCSPESTLADWVDWGANNTTSSMLRQNVGIRGYEHNGTAPGNSFTLPGTLSFSSTPAAPIPNNTQPGSDVLILQHRNTQQVTIAGPASAASTGASNAICLGGVVQAGATIRIAEAIQVPQNSLVFFEKGCQGGDLFVNTNPVGNGAASFTKGANRNLNVGPNGFCNEYSVGQQVSLTLIEQRAFFVALGTNNEPTLYMQTFDTQNKQLTREEIISGVETMQVTFGLHNNASTRTVDRYVSANAVSDWRQVVSVSISLLLRSPDNVLPEPKSHSFTINGTTIVTPTDRRARVVLTSTTAIRNKTL